jgi:hypothetical protein
MLVRPVRDGAVPRPEDEAGDASVPPKVREIAPGREAGQNGRPPLGGIESVLESHDEWVFRRCLGPLFVQAEPLHGWGVGAEPGIAGGCLGDAALKVRTRLVVVSAGA